MNQSNESFDNGNKKRYINRRSIMDIGMGFLWVCMGVFFIFVENFNQRVAEAYDKTSTTIFGVICVIYGTFRIYRGITKKYLKD